MILCQLSGGIDSAIALALNHKSGTPTQAIYIHMGNAGHKIAAEKVAQYYDVKLHTVDIVEIKKQLTVGSGPMVAGYKPMIDLLSLSMAYKLKATHLITGELDFEHGEGDDTFDHQWRQYLDNDKIQEADYVNRFDFVDLFNRMYGSRIVLSEPLFYLDKKSAIRLGSALGVPYGLTVSCQKLTDGGNCGSCMFCQSRIDAFKTAGIHDPTIYG